MLLAFTFTDWPHRCDGLCKPPFGMFCYRYLRTGYCIRSSKKHSTRDHKQSEASALIQGGSSTHVKHSVLKGMSVQESYPNGLLLKRARSPPSSPQLSPAQQKVAEGLRDSAFTLGRYGDRALKAQRDFRNSRVTEDRRRLLMNSSPRCMVMVRDML